MIQAKVICLVLFMQDIACALYFALANAGNSIAASIAMIAITTSNSIKVKPIAGARKAGFRSRQSNRLLSESVMRY